MPDYRITRLTPPLLIRHLEEADLGHGAGDVEQSVDAAECGQGLVHHRPCAQSDAGRVGSVELTEMPPSGQVGYRRNTGVSADV